MATKITVLPRGPYEVEVDTATLVGTEGKTLDVTGKAKIYLCRCGGSQNKPFCDGTHNKIGFGASTPTPTPTPTKA